MDPISADIFAAIGNHIAANGELIDKVGKVFQFKLSNPDSVWTVDVANDKGGVAPSDGGSPTPDCTLELTDTNFMAMCTGRADAQKLYFSGDLKISGDIMASQKLSFLKKLDPQLVVAAMQARGGGAASDDGSAPTAPASAEPTSGDVFLGIKAYVADNPALIDKIQTVFLFKLTGPDSAWTVNIRDGKGGVEPGEGAKPDCTLEIADSDFMAMTGGKADAQKLYFAGKLKISGNIMASQKLSFLQKIDPEWAKEAVAKLKAEGAGDAARAAQVSTPKRQALAPAIFGALDSRITEESGLADEVRALIHFKVDDAAWTVNLKGDASVASGTSGDADATFTIADEDLVALVKGEHSAQELFQRGKLHIDGDIRVAHRLGFMNKLL